jgi:hypothetical protein
MDYFTAQREHPGSLASFSQRVADRMPDDEAGRVREVFVEGLRRMYQTDFVVPEFIIRHPDQPVEMAVEGVAEVIERVWHESSGPETMTAALYASQLLVAEWLDFLDRAEITKTTPAMLAEALDQLPGRVIPRFGIAPHNRAEYQAALLHFSGRACLH